MHADVLAPVRAAASRAHGHGTIRDALVATPCGGLVDRDVGGTGRAEVVAVDDSSGVGRVTETFGERGQPD